MDLFLTLFPTQQDQSTGVCFFSLVYINFIFPSCPGNCSAADQCKIWRCSSWDSERSLIESFEFLSQSTIFDSSIFFHQLHGPLVFADVLSFHGRSICWAALLSLPSNHSYSRPTLMPSWTMLMTFVCTHSTPIYIIIIIIVLSLIIVCIYIYLHLLCSTYSGSYQPR